MIESKGINVLSVFNGMGCVFIALDKLGVKVNRRFSSEIDKFANIANDANYPDTIQLGDITKIKGSDLPHIDLIIGGSPCQGFSFAGKGLNFEDPRSKLFFEFVRLVKEIKPKYFFLENVKMKKEHELVISNYLGIAPININSALLSAQTRNRLYWCNIAAEPYGLFGDLACTIPQPKDKGILLKDILQPQEEVDKKYFLSEKMINSLSNRPKEYKSLLPKNENGKADTLVASMAKMHSSDNYIKIDKQGNIKDNQGKASCITGGGHSGGNHSDMDLIVGCDIRSDEGLRISNTEKSFTLRSASGGGLHGRGVIQKKHQQDLLNYSNNKARTLVAGCHGNSKHYTKTVIQINSSEESGGKQPFQQNRIYDTDGISPALNVQLSTGSNLIEIGDYRSDEGFRPRKNGKAPTLTKGAENSGTQYNSLLKTNNTIRRLTPIECCRLQTVPDNFFYKDGKQIISDSQMYKLLGNGFTCDVIAYILSFAKWI
jgi:DNA (cytosine-5)-methyltransferase 3A